MVVFSESVAPGVIIPIDTNAYESSDCSDVKPFSSTAGMMLGPFVIGTGIAA